MKTKLVLLILLAAIMAGCFAPMNLNYDSAKTLGKGQLSVQGMYSRYNVTGDDSVSSGLINQNFGVELGYGISDRYTLKAKYEFISPSITFDKVFGDDNTDLLGMNSMSYFEVNNKFMIVSDHMSLGMPLGAYFYNKNIAEAATGGLGWFTFDPRLYISFFRSTNVFEFTMVPKVHILFGEFGGYVQPGVSLGFGFSSNLDKWAIRPEIGYDRFLSFGVGASINLNTSK